MQCHSYPVQTSQFSCKVSTSPHVSTSAFLDQPCSTTQANLGPQLSRQAGLAPSFQYHPLDRTKPSIRLLSILPDLATGGFIQCKLWHDEVTAQYDCLSYVWGSDNHEAISQNQKHILVNGAKFRVRHNLYGFMMVARTKYAAPQHTIWIDAICIDQYSVAERNHQVAQMGSIYSNAREVIAWLGYSPRIERALKYCLYFARRNPQSQLEAWEIWNDRFSLMEEWTELQEHPYWRRAWITQEIVSARRFKLLINHFEVEPARFSAIGILLPNITLGKLFNTYLEVLCGKRSITNLSLLDLLNEVPGRESQIPRDRIYSLLSIASDAATIPIDYASSDSSLFLSLLSIHRKNICFCLWIYLATTMELQKLSGVHVELRVESHKLLFKALARPIAIVHSTYHWHQCSICRENFYGRSNNDIVVCLRELCTHASGHLLLRQHMTKGGIGYTISLYAPGLDRFSDPDQTIGRFRALDHTHIHVAQITEEVKLPANQNNNHNDNDNRKPNAALATLEVSLTPAGMRLLQSSTDPRHPAALCTALREGRGRLTLQLNDAPS